jgi:hypothetical protein
LQFITTSTYHRCRLFTCQRLCWTFVDTLRQVRQETGLAGAGRAEPCDLVQISKLVNRSR